MTTDPDLAAIERRLRSIASAEEKPKWSVLWTHYQSDAKKLLAEVRRLQAENTTLRHIASHVPAKIYIAAKESSGHPNYVHTAE